MASLYKNGTSPFWWLKWRNPESGQIERFSTQCRIGDGRAYTKAIQLRNERAVKETRVATPLRQHPFHSWVNDYLEASHCNAPKTLTRYLSTWRLLATYLNTRDIVSPVQVRREDCLGYVAWRRKVPHLNNRVQGKGKPVKTNTVILEIKVLSKIMQEAVARKYIDYNPCTRLKLKKEPSRPKEEMSDDHIAIIQREIQRRLKKADTTTEREVAEFLQVSFDIARLQGIRLSETHIALADVDLHDRTLVVMGKGKKLETLNMNPELIPLFTRLKAEDKSYTYTPPRMPSLTWFKVFKTIRNNNPGFKNVSYHSTRVTVISRMERAGAPENVVMKTVLHSSTTVHRVYRKLKAAELAPYWRAVSSPAEKNPDAAKLPGENPA